MATFLVVTRKEQVFSAMAAGLLGMSLSASSSLAASNSIASAQEIGAKPTGTTLERPVSAKASPRNPIVNPDRSGNFVYEIINSIRARSEELCARYGSSTDCLEEAEVCLTMRDTQDNQIRLCLNTVPDERGSDRGGIQKSRVKR